MSTFQPPPLTLVNGALQVSPTQLAQMRRCFQEWGYVNVWKRQPNRPAANRDAGKAGHAGLEALVRARMRGESEEAARAAMEAAVTAAFAGLEVPEKDAWRTPVRYIEALRGYLEHWGSEEARTLGCELPFSIELGVVNGVRVVLRGIIDRVLHMEGVTFIADYKFKDNWSQAAQVQYQRDPQFKLYALALSELYATHPELGLPTVAKGAMVDVIVQREPFARAYSEAALAKMKPRVEYHRCKYYYTAEQLEETRQHALGWVRMALQQHAEGRFVQSEGNCSFYFGNGSCPFLDCCSVPVEQRQMVLDSDLYRDKLERDLVAAEETP